MNSLVRKFHRWVSVIFTIVVLIVTIASSSGEEPAEWVFLTPLLPLGLLFLSGVYLFVLPYVARRRGRVSD